MSDCARACTQWRRHDEKTCPVGNGQDGAWVPAVLDPQSELAAALDELRSVVLDTGWPDEERDEAESTLRDAGYTISRYGGLEVWHPCGGCLPRPAERGVLCDQCWLRLSAIFTGPRNLAWCWYWLGPELTPSQSTAGDKVGGSRTPPAPIAVGVHDLRQDILTAIGRWLGEVCAEFGLFGPDWWRTRAQTAITRRDPHTPADWRALQPQDVRCSATDDASEIVDACRWLGVWLTSISRTEHLVLPMHDLATRLHGRVRQTAPWEPKAQRMPGLVCPACEREALVRWEGDEHLTCRRCGEKVQRQRYDVWSVERESEREAS